MKNPLLYCLAAAALTLSFCFEKLPDASASAGAPSSQVAPAVAEASLLPAFSDSVAAPTGRPALPAPAAARDSLAYGYYAQTLGLKLAHTENKSLLQTVIDWVGTPYRYGAASRQGTDCSGFVTRVFQQVYGITLQRSSRSMFSRAQRVAKADLQPGDLVFFRHQGGAIYHVGIYLKNGKFAHSATNGGVMVSSLSQPYYQRNFYAAGRMSGVQAANASAAATSQADAGPGADAGH
ncbi:C40 family peptidase [uncultured Hymenobacter sp.]|uniref:C40 family peptidase n=1 Tax=uncultured Hymenobacter sp. TaxID=170016 RepID=UPI0035CC0BA6